MWQLIQWSKKVVSNCLEQVRLHHRWNLLLVSNVCEAAPRSSSETQGQIVGARESLNRRKNKARRRVKSGQKTQVFWHQSEARTAATVPRGSSRRSLLFFVPYFSARLDFPSPHYLPLGLRGCYIRFYACLSKAFTLGWG